MTTQPWYKILALALFWDFASHGEQARLEVFLPVLLLILLLDARIIKSENQSVARSWSAWPLFASLAVLAVGFTYLASGKAGSQHQASAGCSYQGCGGSLDADAANMGGAGCQCRSKAKAPSQVNYVPVQRPPTPQGSFPQKRTFNGVPSRPPGITAQPPGGKPLMGPPVNRTQTATPASPVSQPAQVPSATTTPSLAAPAAQK
ncbi:hypothetical protein SAMN02745166_04857 [Prosthecobacter debontii]|uniref:Uncharacterized protein n=1 Tax=Prosthecobacter debontii TaxID=48467 RepID=A0A1T4Z2J6_9BACT|nr:hypothetical protein SAMN02745166_04857 [Prosthecobacter debontii]